MSDTPSIDRPPRRWQFRLWHLAVAVLVASFFLALLHFVRASQPQNPGLGISIAITFAVMALYLIPAMAFILGFKLANRLASSLYTQAERRGGGLALIAPGLGILVYVVVGLGTTALVLGGPIVLLIVFSR